MNETSPRSRRSKKTKKRSTSPKRSLSPEFLPKPEEEKDLQNSKFLEESVKKPAATEESKASPVPTDEFCIWHYKSLSLYCEIREEPLCEDCLTTNYKGTNHKIISIDEAYRYRIASIYNTLSTHLFGRKEQLEAQSRRVEFRLDELKRLQNVIERDMQSEFGGIFERLGSSFNSHGGLIQSDISSLSSDLESVNVIIGELNSSDQDLVKFLLNFKKLKFSLEQAISKPFRSDIKIQPSDLPRELEEIRNLSSKCLKLEALIEVKNEMIWKFLHDRVPTCAVSKEIENELKQWGTLAEKFEKELEKYELMCDFCGAVLEENVVNSQCPKNSSYSLSIDSSKYPANFKGNSRHFFKKIPAQEKNEGKNPEKYADVDDKILQKISQKARTGKLDVEKLFTQYDCLNSGFIAPTDFYYLMVESFALNGEETTELIFRYDKSREGRIKYMDIVDAITAKLPEPFEKLRKNAGLVLEKCKQKDRLTIGAISLEQFKDVLRQVGLVSEEIEEAIKVTSKNAAGRVLYLEFHDKIA